MLIVFASRINRLLAALSHLATLALKAAGALFLPLSSHGAVGAE